MFGFVVLPITFLGGTYYEWIRLAPVKIGGWHWLQTVVLINPLHIRERGHAGRVHERAAHPPVHHLSGADRVHIALLGDRPPQLQPKGALLTTGTTTDTDVVVVGAGFAGLVAGAGDEIRGSLGGGARGS